MTGGALLFWLCTALLAWVYAGYPALAALVARIRPFRVTGGGAGPRLVTVGIAAHDEGQRLRERIADVLAQDVPFDIEVIIASDGSSDGSAEIVAGLAATDPRVRLLDLPRGGQTAAQNAIFAAARGEVVMLSDAETRFAPGCLAALVAPFDDPRVGCTTGRLAWLEGKRTETSRNEGAYWRYEQAVRRLESGAGWLTAVTGALLAMRGANFRAVPAHASMDHLLPLYVRDDGLIVLAVPEAVATDRGIAGLRDQYRNRARTATRGIRANLSMVGRLTPWRRPSAFIAVWSHKLLRWATPWLALAALAGAALAVSTGEAVYLLPLGVAAVGLASAGLGYVLRARGRHSRWTSLALAVVVVNLAFLAGWLNLVRGQRIAAWHHTDWRTVADEANPPSG